MPHCTVRVQHGQHNAPLFTWTSAMDCWSFSIPAFHTCPHAVTRSSADICNGCYARINRYAQPLVLDAQWTRYLWLKDHVTPDRGTAFLYNKAFNTLVSAIKSHSDNPRRKRGRGYFRIHDSGDFFNVNYVHLWWRVCMELPNVRFWAPTRAWPHGEKKLPSDWLLSLIQLASLPNVTLRPSALSFNDPAPNCDGYARGSTAYTEDFVGTATYRKFHDGNYTRLCPKSMFGGSCESNDCRICWDRPDHSVAYLAHGRMGNHTPPVVSDNEKEQSLASKRRIQLTINRA